jgi:hypothetical protein
MKSLYTLALVAGMAVGILSQPLSAEPLSGEITGHRVSSVSGYVVKGTPRIAVLHHLQRPCEKLSEDVWLYRGYGATNPSAATADAEWLVVVFERGSVRDLRLTTAAGARALLASGTSTVAGSVASSR